MVLTLGICSLHSCLLIYPGSPDPQLAAVRAAASHPLGPASSSRGKLMGYPERDAVGPEACGMDGSRTEARSSLSLSEGATPLECSVLLPSSLRG